jgi:hypothetical protein
VVGGGRNFGLGVNVLKGLPLNPVSMNEKVLYQSRSSVNTFAFVFSLVLCGCAMLFCAMLFTQAPGRSILGMVVAFFFLIYRSTGSIIVRSDRFIVVNKRLLPGFSDRVEFPFSGIAKIEANLSLTPGIDVLSFLFSNSTSKVVKNTLCIVGKDGSVSKLSPKIYKDELRKAIECIHAHSRIPVEFQGNDI